MNFNFQNKNILVTGSGSGIGRAIAMSFAVEGANVIVNDIDKNKAVQTINLINEAGCQASMSVFDVTNIEEVEEAFRHLSVDILINNAATVPENSLFLNTPPESCDRDIQVSLYGTMNCCRAALPGMIERSFGRIINIVSDAARAGQAREVSYSAAKGGVISFTKSLAREVGEHHITVNALSPAATNTPLRQELLKQIALQIGEEKLQIREEKIRRLYPVRRIGEVSDVSNYVMYLASDYAQFITGQIISVNGGYLMPG